MPLKRLTTGGRQGLLSEKQTPTARLSSKKRIGKKNREKESGKRRFFCNLVEENMLHYKFSL